VPGALDRDVITVRPLRPPRWHYYADETWVDFNITGAANLTSRPPTPGFKAYCVGSGEGAPYELCTRLDDEDTDAVVVAKLLPSNITPNGTRIATIQVSLRYTDLYTP
jgi:hypothetical protein